MQYPDACIAQTRHEGQDYAREEVFADIAGAGGGWWPQLHMMELHCQDTKAAPRHYVDEATFTIRFRMAVSWIEPTSPYPSFGADE